ncbi:hypothetical protein VTK73DRAFT_8570 [Phialemonium thermophilum]|uniref:Uncharacterized protein n=1 Tax=Phialemonium thermophilum TaxID=223376 RepID=A0ABR3W7Q3_9PEZI
MCLSTTARAPPRRTGWTWTGPSPTPARQPSPPTVPSQSQRPLSSPARPRRTATAALPISLRRRIEGRGRSSLTVFLCSTRRSRPMSLSLLHIFQIGQAGTNRNDSDGDDREFPMASMIRRQKGQQEQHGEGRWDLQGITGSGSNEGCFQEGFLGQGRKGLQCFCYALPI